MITRSFALFVAVLTVMNLTGDLLWPGFDASTSWINLGPVPAWITKPLLAVLAFTMLAFALRPPNGLRRSIFTAGMALLFAFIALANAVVFFRLAATRRIGAGFPAPLSLVVFLGMLLIARSAWSGQKLEKQSNARFQIWQVAAGCALLFALYPLALMLFLGNTDYRRPADVVVVFGARVYANGRLSDALEDRIRTACEIYHSGLAKRLVLSGGAGDGDLTEAGAMRRYALSHGVRDDDIFIDDKGRNTEATVRNTVPLFRQWGAQRVLAVSHFYHLPRIKLAYERAGFEVFTVPARQAHLLIKLPFNMAREVAAYWVYYFKQKPMTRTTPGASSK